MSISRPITRLTGLKPRQFHSTALKSRPHSHPTHPHPVRTNVHSAPTTAPNTAGHSTPHAAPSNGVKKPSPHLVWYREIVPAMVPILLLSSTIFLSLTLLRTHLSHSLSLSESSARIAELETQLEGLRRRQARQREKDRKERERILPLVVERVLQKVGAMSEEEEDEEELPLLV